MEDKSGLLSTASEGPVESRSRSQSARAALVPGGSSSCDVRNIRGHRRRLRTMYKSQADALPTTPVDFETFMLIYGGFGRWQLAVCLLLGLVLLPYKMGAHLEPYNLYQPEHWCYVQHFDANLHPGASNWSQFDIRPIVAPLEITNGSGRLSSCRMYDRKDYHSLAHMQPSKARQMALKENVTVKGCDAGWTFSDSVMKETFVTTWSMVCNKRWRLVQTALVQTFGRSAGALMAGVMADRFGRKPALATFALVGGLLSFSLPYASTYELFCLLCFLSVACDQAVCLTIYCLMVELTPAKYRAHMVAQCQVVSLGACLMVMLVVVINGYWKTLQLAKAILSTLVFTCLFYTIESPRWLIANNRYHQAELIIRKACHCNGKSLPADLELIGTNEEGDFVHGSLGGARVRHVLQPCYIFKRTLLSLAMSVVLALVQCSLRSSLEHGEDEQQRQLVNKANYIQRQAIKCALAVPEFAVFFLCARYLQRQIGTCGLLICHCLIVIVWYLISNRLAPWTAVVLLLLGDVVVTSCWHVHLLSTAESFPTTVRCTVLGIYWSLFQLTTAAWQRWVEPNQSASGAALRLLLTTALAFLFSPIALLTVSTEKSPLPVDTISASVERDPDN